MDDVTFDVRDFSKALRRAEADDDPARIRELWKRAERILTKRQYAELVKVEHQRNQRSGDI